MKLESILGPRRSLVTGIVTAAALMLPALSAHAAGSPSGGTGVASPPRSTPRPPGKHAKGKWLRNFTLTEYWPVPESWFVGRLVKAPGLPGKHRIDWLYSALGVSMEGEGIGLDGRFYHLENGGEGGWVQANGRPTSASDGFAAGAPYWRAGEFWRNRSGGVTFPLQRGGWSSGKGRKFVPLPGVSFAPGVSAPLHYYQSIAVDPRVIPLGSRVYIPAYRNDGHGGWFVAQDTGGAIGGHHLDIFRPPPQSATIGGHYFTGQRVFVVRAKH
jgi:3D (Asp-Asp-Asp) domain-containing protein